MLSPDDQRSRNLFNEVWAACADHTKANIEKTGDSAKLFDVMRQKFTEFSKHERAIEREACAKVAEADTSFDMLQDFGMQSHSAQLRTNIADAIRDRSTTTK